MNAANNTRKQTFVISCNEANTGCESVSTKLLEIIFVALNSMLRMRKNEVFWLEPRVFRWPRYQATPIRGSGNWACCVSIALPSWKSSRRNAHSTFENSDEMALVRKTAGVLNLIKACAGIPKEVRNVMNSPSLPIIRRSFGCENAGSGTQGTLGEYRHRGRVRRM